MGLFDFLKKKPADETAATPAPAQPAATTSAPAAPEAEDTKTAGGPRYQRPAFAAKSAAEMQPAAPALSSMPELPPMPEMPAMPPFDPKNNLENALLMASQDPQFRLAFYHELLNAEVLVLTAIPEGGQPGEITVDEGAEIQLQVLHDGRIPMFSSEERIIEGGASANEVAFIRVRGEGFLHMTKGAECVLNPFSPYGKLLVLPEIEDLLSGRIFAPPAEEAQGPQAQLVPMAEHPAELKTALQDFCAQHPHIEAVYLSDVLIEGEEAPTRMLLAFKVDGEDMEFLQELGPILQAHLPNQDTMDVARLSPDPNEPLTQYFNQQEPLYERTLA
ncbi:hypothetical protein D3Y59_03400 [Hymenobacter oligotrophus]|uniref:Enhanced serine sensitivity protein SseB n=1 Tax=Hymenobacter oligotrophus TaxID=2319843 RepID=A0A3B7QXW1_9BACT|nr:enhanced serine sensitivity protein SseB C-terminal domain-containing protein [Hymenobacter oligotrophus]AYA36192.1 hypothetical protein D3Y59_03400 [Hymenobacter oligotrophus]